jgi:hypothetical protein
LIRSAESRRGAVHNPRFEKSSRNCAHLELDFCRPHPPKKAANSMLHRNDFSLTGHFLGRILVVQRTIRDARHAEIVNCLHALGGFR